MTAQPRPSFVPASFPLSLAPRWIALGLFVLTLLTRIPLRTRFLYHWDSVNYALALEQFSVLAHHPHPPGYLFYVALGNVMHLFVADANAAYVWISVLASAFAVAFLDLFASEMFDAGIGLWAGLFLLTSPLFWFYGQVALPYTLDVAIAILIGWACLRAHRGRGNAVWASALLMGLVGGVRPQTTIILFPLWVYAVWRQGAPRLILGLLLMGVAALVWLLPLAFLSGGISEYLALLSRYSAGLQSLSPLVSANAFVGNLGRSLLYLVYGFPLGLPVIVYAGLQSIRGPERWKFDERSRLLLLWLLPALGFYMFFHLQQPGHLTIAMPPLAILLALVIAGQGEKTARFLGAAVVVTSILFFLFAPARLLPRPEGAFMTPTLAALRARETFLQSSIDTLRRDFDLKSTALLGVSQVYHQPEFYLREYKRYTEELTRRKERILLPLQYRRLVLYGNSNEGDWSPPQDLAWVQIGQSQLYFLEARAGEQIFIEPAGFGIIPATTP